MRITFLFAILTALLIRGASAQLHQTQLFIDDGLGNFLQLKYNGAGSPATWTLPAPGSGGALSSDGSGTLSIGTLSIANGGTGSGTASGATTNLLPSQTGNSGKVLSTNGTGTLSWVSAPAGTGIILVAVNSGGNLLNNGFLIMGNQFSSANESETQIVATRSETLQNLFVHLTSSPDIGSSWTFTVRKNGSNTTLAVTITGASTTGSDVADNVAISAFDLISIQVSASGAPSPAVGAASFEIAY